MPRAPHRDPLPEDFDPVEAEDGPSPDDLAPLQHEEVDGDSLEKGVDAVLGPGGALAQLAGGYEERPQQLQMARTVARAIAQGRHAVVEAGTGTGKTLGYLVPALLSGKRIVVATATRALQEQLVDKDLPLMERLGARFRSAVMKGRQNYLCLLRFEQFDADPVFVSREEAGQYARVRTWARQTQTGDRAELDIPERYVAWRDVSSSAETCIGQECPRWSDCHVVKMRQRAQEADIVVVNHHLYFADLALRSSPASKVGIEIIPRHEVLVFDEAHNMEEIATEFFGLQISNYRVFDLCRDIDRLVATHPEWPVEELKRGTKALGAAAEAYFGAIAKLAPPDVVRRAPPPPRPKPLVEPPKPAPRELSLFDRPSDKRELTASDAEVLARAVILSDPGPEQDEGERRDARWTIEPGALRTVDAARLVLAAELRGLGEVLARTAKEHEDAVLEPPRRRTQEMLAQLDMLSATDQPGFVRWAELRGRGVFLRASPVDVAGDLRRLLFDKPVPVIMTSATLATGGDMAFFRRRVGLGFDDNAPLEEVLASPFDFERQAALYLPRHLPDPSDEQFIVRAVEEIAALSALAGGRTFALFTSVRSMQEAHRRLAPRMPYRVLLQGERPKAALLRAFREEPSVLFATQSFWEGVDVPGDALSMVVIDKLPFASPGDPLVSARMQAINDRGGSSFGEYQLPAAAITLKQGFGRLIRTRRDTGAVAVLDRRLWTKSYGGYFRRSLPACPTFQQFADLKQWWRERRGAPEGDTE